MLCCSSSSEFLSCLPAYLLISAYTVILFGISFVFIYSAAEVATLSATFIKVRALSSDYLSLHKKPRIWKQKSGSLESVTPVSGAMLSVHGLQGKTLKKTKTKHYLRPSHHFT